MPDSAGFVQDTEPFRRELLAHWAWRSYGGFEGRSSVRTWLYQIATNACLTELARHSRRVLPSGLCDREPNPGAYPEEAGTEVNWLQPAPDAMVASDSAHPAVIVAAREGRRLALIASLQYLPPTQRAVLVLRNVLAFPASEVAVMLGITTVSVKSALQRARARLKDLDLAAGQVESLDMLINNAGIALPDDLTDLAVLERHLAVNLFGTYAVTQAFLPAVTRARGHRQHSVGERSRPLAVHNPGLLLSRRRRRSP